MKSKKVKVDTKTLYQLLLSEERYGCSRNNHLMPYGAFENIKTLIVELNKVDSEWAYATIRQICEEVINELVLHFDDIETDENNNRPVYIKFINWCLEYIHKNFYKDYEPYNYFSFLENINRDYEKRYNVYEVIYSHDKISTSMKKLNDEPLGKIEIPNFVANMLNVNAISYSYERNDCKNNDKQVVSYIYHIKQPEQKDIYILREL